MPDSTIFDRLEAAVNLALGTRRARHCFSVAELAAELCAREGLDPAAGRLAGLAHDLCRALPRGDQEALARSCPVPGAAGLASDTRFAHGPAAATVLSRDYAVADAAILEAVAFHTLPNPESGPLTRILYLADKFEPGRDHHEATERLRVLSLPLDDAFRAAVEGVVDWIRAEGLPLAPETAALYNAIRNPNR